MNQSNYIQLQKLKVTYPVPLNIYVKKSNKRKLHLGKNQNEMYLNIKKIEATFVRHSYHVENSVHFHETGAIATL